MPLRGAGKAEKCACRLVLHCAALPRRQCPVLDIMLQGGQRGVGMCTDAMLYVLHMGARVIGRVDDPQQYNSYCGPATARLLLETIYSDFISSQPGVLHLHLVNHEHLWKRDAHLHKQVDYFLVSKAPQATPCPGCSAIRRQQHGWGQE